MGVFRQFPYSNFHDLNMDQILKIMREMQDEWVATKTEWSSYKDYIDNYFKNLDVSAEVLEALRAMAASGELARVIDPEIATATAAWLAANITPTTPAIDASLSVSGAGADAKVTGNRIGDADRAIENNAQVVNIATKYVPFMIRNNRVFDANGVMITSQNFACIVTRIPNGALLYTDDDIDIQLIGFKDDGTFVVRGTLKSLTAGSITELYNSNSDYVCLNVRFPNNTPAPDANEFSRIIHLRSVDVTYPVDLNANNYIWEYGKIQNDGTDVRATDGLRTLADKPFTDDVIVTAGEGISYRAVVKLKAGGYVSSDTFTGTHKFELTPAQESYRLAARYTDQSTIFDPLDILNNITFDNIDQYTYRGAVIDNSRVTFESCVASGYYGFTAADLDVITDKPDTLVNGGVLRVERKAATGQVFQTIVNTLGQSWFRYGSNPWASTSGHDVTWYALGDSITQGFTSSGGEIGPVTSNNWVTNVARLNGYNFTNYGEGGAGYLHPGTVGTQTNAKAHVNSIDFSDCDLVTLAYGVNDWHYNMAIGSVSDDKDAGNSMCANMKYCIEKILSDNPLCKIIVLTPFNCSAFGGTFATNWGFGQSLPTSGTLKQVVDAIISVCEYYGIEYIEQGCNSIVSRSNINQVLSDGLHPIAELYPALGKDLASKINMK